MYASEHRFLSDLACQPVHKKRNITSKKNLIPYKLYNKRCWIHDLVSYLNDIFNLWLRLKSFDILKALINDVHCKTAVILDT